MSKIFENNHVIIEESDIKDICYEMYDNHIEGERLEGYDEYDIGLITERVMNELIHLTNNFEEGTGRQYKEVKNWDELYILIEDYLQEVIYNRN